MHENKIYFLFCQRQLQINLFSGLWLYLIQNLLPVITLPLLYVNK